MKNFDYIAPELMPENEVEADAFAQAGYVADLQSGIHRMMVAKGVSRADLAGRLGLSRARVTQYFAGDGSNLTAKTVARIFHALGERVETTCDWLRAQEVRRTAERQKQSIKVDQVFEPRRPRTRDWCQVEHYGPSTGSSISKSLFASLRSPT